MDSCLFFQCMPYALKRLADGSVILLNRFYKPLGFDRKQCGWVEYESQPCMWKVRLPWAEIAKRLDYELQPETSDLIFLYDANTSPFRQYNPAAGIVAENWINYCARLQVVASLELERNGVSSRI